VSVGHKSAYEHGQLGSALEHKRVLQITMYAIWLANMPTLLLTEFKDTIDGAS